MEDDEKHVHAVQHKNRVDLITANAKEWDIFIQRKSDFTDKYGAVTANRLLAKDEAALIEKHNKSHHSLDEREQRQWFNFYDGKPLDEPEIKKEVEFSTKKQPEKPTITGRRDDKMPNDDMTEKANRMLEERKRQQEEMKARSRERGRSE